MSGGLVTSGVLDSEAPVQSPSLVAGPITAYLERQDKVVNEAVLDWMMAAFKKKVLRQLMTTRATRQGHDSNTMYSGPCAVKAWHTYHGSVGEPVQARAVLKWLLGDTVELDVVGIAQLAGVQLVDNNRDLFVTSDGDKVQVHPDGRVTEQMLVGAGPSQVMAWANYNFECKSCDTFTFDAWLANGGPDDKWGYLCVPLDTEILTLDGWKTGEEIKVGETVLGYDHKTGALRWEPVLQVHRYPHFNDELVVVEHASMSMAMTPRHRVPVMIKKRGIWERTVMYAEELRRVQRMKLPVAGSYDAAKTATHSDDFVRLVGWFVTEGCITHRGKWAGGGYTGNGKKLNPNGMLRATLSQKYNGKHGRAIRELAERTGCTVYGPDKNGMMTVDIKAAMRDRLLTAAPQKELKVEFLAELTSHQLHILFNILIDGDGSRNKKATHFWQKNVTTRGAFEALCVLLGKSCKTSFKKNCDVGQTYVWEKGSVGLDTAKISRQHHKGMVWCPSLPSGFWVAKRHGRVFLTGNTQASVEIAAWREAGYDVHSTCFVAVSTGSRQGSIAEWIIPYDQSLVDKWHERRRLARAAERPPIPFRAEMETEFVKGKAIDADVAFAHGEPAPRLDKNGNVYGWDVATGRFLIPTTPCGYCAYKGLCWPFAQMDVERGKPKWIV